MHKILQKLEALSCRKLHWIAVGLSILIAAQVQYIQHGWINPDSVLYLEAAKLFTQGAWKAGFAVFPWPFYSLCIASISKISALNVHLSAQILNVLFFSIATYSFIQIIQLAGGKQRQMIAGMLIWLSAQYMIGGVLEMLMRDEGFWAFYLSSLVFFIRYYQQHQFKDALLWQICIIFATLFRIEAILFLMFLPLILLWQANTSPKLKWQRLLQTNAINISLALFVVIIFSLNDHTSSQLLGRLNEIFTSNLWQQFSKNLTDKSAIMSSQVLGEYLNEFATTGLLLTFFYVMCVKMLGATGLINVGLSAMAIKHRKSLIDNQAFQVLRVAAFIAVLNMALIITKVFVLSSRYVLALSFILMVLASFYFAELLYKNHENKKNKWLTLALILFMLGGAIKNTLPKKAGYNYQQQAVSWVEKYNQDNLPIFYDDCRMRFFAKQPFTGTWGDNWQVFLALAKSEKLEDYQLIALSSNVKTIKTHVAKEYLKNYHEIKRFYDARKRKFIIIYEKSH